MYVEEDIQIVLVAMTYCLEASEIPAPGQSRGNESSASSLESRSVCLLEQRSASISVVLGIAHLLSLRVSGACGTTALQNALMA